MNPLFRAIQAEEAARLARAVEQGYTIDAYKGAPSRVGGPTTDWKGRVLEDAPWEDLTHFDSPNSPYAGFFSNDPSVASRFADAFGHGYEGSRPAVFPTKLKMERPYTIDVGGKHAATVQFDSPGSGWDAREYKAALDNPDYDGVILKNTKDEGDVYIPKTPQQVRSKFAQFKDPTSKDLLAARVPVGAAPENERMSERQRRRRNPVFGPPSTEEIAAAASVPFREFLTGGPAPMEPDLLATQQGAVPEPGQTRRPNVIPITRDAETGRPMLAMPRLLDMLMSGTPSTLPSRVAPVAAGAGEMVLGAGGAKKGGLGGLGGSEGKTWWSDLSKTKLRVPLEDMSATREKINDLTPRRDITPENLEGGILLPAIGDRTMGGSRLTHINEKKLKNPVILDAGSDFMRDRAAQGPDKAIWASGGSVISKEASRIRHAAEKHPDRPMFYLHSAMGGESGDFSRMMADAYLGQMPHHKVGKDAIAKFDEEARKLRPDWPGLAAADKIAEHGPFRLALAKTGERKEIMDLGFPDIASTRNAITNPELRDVPGFATGHTIGRLDPSAPVVKNPVFAHGTYPVQMTGQGYEGSFQHLLPKEIAWPSNFNPERRSAAGDPMNPSQQGYAFRIQGIEDPVQIATPEWVDRAMKWWEQQPARGSSLR